MSRHLHNEWMPISDLMSGFVVVLMVLFVVATARQRFDESTKDKSIKQHRAALFNDLRNRLVDAGAINLNAVDSSVVILDEQRQTIRLASDAAFDTGSACPTDIAKKAIASIAPAIARELNADAELTIQIEGHSDPVKVSGLRNKCGHFEDNVQLSERRATKVKALIAEHLRNLQHSETLLWRIPVTGWGPDRLLDTSTVTSPKNRRVELHFAWRIAADSDEHTAVP
jgi:flagellar motor protein MotB